MATIRVEKSSNYTVLSNHHLDDPRLSLKAVGLLSYMLRQPDGWDFTVEWLAGRHKDGRDSVRSCLRELEAAGYVVRERTHQEDGRFGGNDYIVREIPAPSAGFPSMVEPSAGNPTLDKPTLENPTQANTNNPSTSIPPIVPPDAPSAADAASPPAGESAVSGKRKRRRRDAKAVPDWKPERFAAFWSAYPRGESKQAAIAAWDALKPDEDLLRVMARALKRQLQSKSWLEGIGIPYASTWINQRRWEDEIKAAPAQVPDPAPPEQNGGYELWT